MDYTEEVKKECLVLHLEGNLDMLNAGILKERLISALDEKYESIVLNLEKVGFVDSSGFGLMILVNDKFQQKTGRKLRISNVSRSIQQIFKISKIGDVMEIYESLDEAVH